MRYDFKESEDRWQKYWEENKLYHARESGDKAKFYSLVMFPYPSGRIHMGHVRNYVIGDVISRYKRMKGYNVLQPIGWDAFGLPAENAAIKNNIPPEKWTRENISYMRGQLKGMGISYDWSREFATCDTEYYRWNQWFFIQMFKKGLAYKKKSSVNWCPSCKTVLANEQVIGEGVCWRCSSVVEEKELEQWFFRISEYAERLLQDMEIIKSGWPEEVLTMQKNWIGKSSGAEVDFEIEGRSNEHLKIFTTRPDTLFGATFMVVAPEHSLIQEKGITPEAKDYSEKSKKRTKRERITTEKTGVFTGIYAINPMNREKIPVWVADYVTMDYGTGAIMCVPAHDQRDFEFAKKYGLRIVEVIKDRNSNHNLDKSAFEGDGTLVNSGEFDNLSSPDAIEKITKHLEARGIGKKETNYRLKDWLISRQRCWGTPIPIVYCGKCGMVPVDEKDLPVLLPRDVKITGTGESPLKNSKEFHETKCPKCGANALRETDTMDTFVDSSWYYARYCDARNNERPYGPEKAAYWLPVDQYVGGIEHACMHLIYARFFHKVMKDLGLVNSDEPFLNLLTQGMVTLGGVAMSKSRGNVVEPSQIIERYGVDTTRLYVLFASPPEKQLEWQDTGIEGCWRFLNRVWRIVEDVNSKTSAEDNPEVSKVLLRKIHQTIHRVTADIEKNYQFNTVIAAIMEFVNELYKYPNLGDKVSKEAVKVLMTLLFPFAPHISCEMLKCFGNAAEGVEIAWPEYDKELLQENTLEVIIQINGKMRGKICIIRDTAQEVVEEKALSEPRVKEYINGKIIKKVYVPNKLLNIVVQK